MPVQELKNLRHDIPAGIVVFVVALPLCLGIAFASGDVDGEQLVPPLAGIVTGIVGGLLVAWLSGSHTSVSGPAASLIVMVLEAVRAYGYPGLLTVTVIAGGMQLVFGALRFGRFGKLFPDAVVKAMLAAIGIILVLKQIPHALGYNADFEGDMAFAQPDGQNTLTEIPNALGHLHLGAVLVVLAGLAILALRERIEWVRTKPWLPGPVLAVLGGIALNEIFVAAAPSLALSGEFLVRLPQGGIREIAGALASPDWSLLTSYGVWVSAAGIAIVASLASLLCADAVDGLDPHKRTTPPSRELIAQGLGNVVSGLLGGTPMTAVIIRGSANVQSGARTRMSAFLHGAALLLAVLMGAQLMNRIPLAALAAVLLNIGYKLASPQSLYKMARRAPDHWVPFFATIGATLFVDLLTGIGLGFLLSIVFIVVRARRLTSTNGEAHLQLGPIVLPLNRFMLRRSMERLEPGTLVIDAGDSDPIDDETREALAEITVEAQKFGVTVDLQGTTAPTA